MRRFYLIIAAFLFLSTSFSFAQQQFQMFKAKEAYSAAASKASESGMENPKLLMAGIGNANQDVMPVSIEFDFNNGTSNAWFFIFRSQDGSKTNAYAVTKIKIIGTQVVEVPFSAILEILPIEPKITIDVQDWIDSDEMINALKGNNYSAKYFDEHPNPEMFFIGLMVIPDNPKVESDKPYWFNSLVDNMMPLNCAVHAQTAEVICGIQLADGEPFTAKAGLSTAKAKAKEDGISSVKIVMIATMKTGAEEIPITNEFDMQEGTAKYWLYLFSEEGNSEKLRAYFVINNTVTGWTAQSIDVSMVLDLFPVTPELPLNDENWIDSDVMIQTYMNHDYFSDFYNQNIDAEAWIYGIFRNEDNPQMEPGETYWGASIVDVNESAPNDSLACAMHAYTKEINCGTVESVEYEYYPAEVNLYPNPSDSKITVEFPGDFILTGAKVEIFNPLGKKLSVRKIKDNYLNFDVSDYTSGVYYVKIISGKKAVLKKFIVR